MICTHTESRGHTCFAPSNGWTKPCTDCPIPIRAQEFINLPESQNRIKIAQRILDAIANDKNPEISDLVTVCQKKI